MKILSIILFIILPFWAFAQDVDFLNGTQFHVGTESAFISYRVDTAVFVNGPIFGVTGLVFAPNEQWFLEGGAGYTSFFFSDEKVKLARIYGMVGVKDETVSRLFAGMGLAYYSNFQKYTTFGPIVRVSVVPYRTKRISFRVSGEMGVTASKLANAKTVASASGAGSLQILYKLW